MAKLMGVTDTEAQTTISSFQYSHVKMDMLGASEYAVVGMAIDLTGSVMNFLPEIKEGARKALQACKKHPLSENVLLRTTSFHGRSVDELHGFQPINGIDETVYDSLPNPYGMTPLNDAVLDSLEAIKQYGADLVKNQYSCSSILFILTDGVENSSRSESTVAKIKDTLADLRSGDPLESFVAVLVGFNDKEYKAELLKFKEDTTIDIYISIGDATPGNLAKFANIVSNSVSTVSTCVTGGNSVQLAQQIGALVV